MWAATVARTLQDALCAVHGGANHVTFGVLNLRSGGRRESRETAPVLLLRAHAALARLEQKGRRDVLHKVNVENGLRPAAILVEVSLHQLEALGGARQLLEELRAAQATAWLFDAGPLAPLSWRLRTACLSAALSERTVPRTA
jgi:hypothetical protein